MLRYRNGKDSIRYNKMNHFFDAFIGYNSVVTKQNTFVKFNVAFGGWYMSKVWSDLYRTDYIHNIMELRNTGNVDSMIKEYPI